MYSGSGSWLEFSTYSVVVVVVLLEYGWWRDFDFFTPFRVLAIELEKSIQYIGSLRVRERA